MAILAALMPWIVYWTLVGNVPFVVAGLAGLALAIASVTVHVTGNRPGRSRGMWAIGTFVALTVLALVSSEAFVAKWVLPLSFLAILVATLADTLAGKPPIREFAAASQPVQVTNSEFFTPTTKLVDAIWLAALVAMFVSSMIPPITRANAALTDADVPVALICYWMVPFLLLGSAALTGRVLLDRMVAEANSPHVVRRSTFVAFKELGIDELMYLAKEKADREVGAGMEAFAVQVGGRGIPLTGDESRESWPVTFKARDRT